MTIAKRHEKELKKLSGVEIDKSGYRFIVGMHIAFFLSFVLEKTTFDRPLNQWWAFLLIVFLAAQVLRYSAIASLGIYWNTKILIAPNHPLVRKGPYRILRHPNYIAVITELATIPLIFSCYITAVVFTILNVVVIHRRIRIETHALNGYLQ